MRGNRKNHGGHPRGASNEYKSADHGPSAGTNSRSFVGDVLIYDDDAMFRRILQREISERRRFG